MAGFRIGEAFIETTLDITQIPQGVNNAIAHIHTAGGQQARAAGQHWGQQISQGMSSTVAPGATTAGQTGGRSFGSGFTLSAGTALKGGLIGLAATAGALFTSSFSKALEQGQVTAKLQAQLGTTPAEAKRYGAVAGQLYTHGITDTFEEGADAIKNVMQQGLIPPDATNAQIQSISGKVTDLSKTFDIDLGGATNAVAQMMKTGLAKNATEALDVLTRGAQTGADKAGDLADTFNEYSTQFGKVGLTGAQAMGLLSQGLQGGARDADIVADSIKEFSIRAVDGSKTTSQGFQALGLNAQDMAEKVAAGGKTSAGALDLTLDKLRSIKDPAEQSRVAVMLFGTQAEDMGKALYSLDPSHAVDTLGKVSGAADDMGKTLHSGAGARIQQFKRTVEQSFVTLVGDYVLPPLTKLSDLMVKVVGPAFDTAKRIIGGFLTSVGAKTGIGSVSDFTTTLQNLGRTLLNDLEPAFSTIEHTFMQKVLPALTGLWNVVTQQLVPAFLAYYQAIASAVLPILDKLAKLWLNTIAPAVMKVYSTFAEHLVPVLSAMATFVKDRVVPEIKNLGDKLQTFVDRAQPVITVVSAVTVFLAQAAATILGTVIPVVIRLAGPIFTLLFDALGTAIDLVSTTIGWLVSFGRAVGDMATATGRFFKQLWDQAVAAFDGTIDAARAAWSWITTSVSNLKTSVTRTWDALWGAVHDTFTTWWGRLKKDVTGAWTWARTSFTNLKTDTTRIWTDMWTAVRDRFTSMWATIHRDIDAAWKWLRGSFTTLRTTVTGTWSSMWNSIYSTGTSMWAKVKKGVNDLKDAVVGAFNKAKDSVSTSWNKLNDITKKPVNFIIGTVYTKGIKALWDKVAKWVGLGTLPAAPKLLAAGGTVGTQPGIYNRPTAIVGEGNSSYPEYVIPTDPKYRKRALALYRSAGTQLMDIGGIIGSAWGGVKGVGSTIAGGAKDVGGYVADKAKDLARGALAPFFSAGMKLVNTLLNQIPGVSTPYGQLMKAVPKKVAGGILSFLKGKDKAANSDSNGMYMGSVSTGVSQWSTVVRSVLNKLGQSLAWTSTVLRRMNQESGGNPNIVNTWDSNWRAGTPSVGLMQVIGPTFRAYAGPYGSTGPFKYGVSVNPTANTYAGVNYAIHRYGSLAALNRAGGYDQGGWLPPGATLAVNATGKPEAVLTAEEAAAFKQMITNPNQLGGLNIAINTVFPPTREQSRQIAGWLADDMRESIRKKERAHR
jgi:SLT domain-containing protein/phage-related protein